MLNICCLHRSEVKVNFHFSPYPRQTKKVAGDREDHRLYIFSRSWARFCVEVSPLLFFTSALLPDVDLAALSVYSAESRRRRAIVALRHVRRRSRAARLVLFTTLHCRPGMPLHFRGRRNDIPPCSILHEHLSCHGYPLYRFLHTRNRKKEHADMCSWSHKVDARM